MDRQLVYIGAGTNLGVRAENLRQAAQLLPPAVSIRRTSAVYQTAPWGYTDQPAFYNLVWEAETTLPPESLLLYLKDIEQKIGRVKNFRYGPRLIDLDILLYGDISYESERLSIPHKQIKERLFVLRPLTDLIPDASHPAFAPLTWNDLMKQAPPMEISKIEAEIDFTAPFIHWGKRTYLMGILNLTPDSFSQDGLLRQSGDPIAVAVERAADFIQSGADILDLGAESTRPGFRTISPTEEQSRLLPALRAIRKEWPNAILSADTRNASTAKAALDAGVNWINDVGGLTYDPEMAAVCAAAGGTVVIMRSESIKEEADTISAVNRQFEALITSARKAGIQDENIVLDPGLGFGVYPEQNLAILQKLQQIKALGFPVLVGASRKSFLGHYLMQPVSERLSGTIASTIIAVQNGADIVRVHDIRANYDAIKLCDIMMRQQTTWDKLS